LIAHSAKQMALCSPPAVLSGIGSPAMIKGLTL
jgi:hypothetical protein